MAIVRANRKKQAGAPLTSLAALLLLSAWPPPAWSAVVPWSDAQQLVLVTTPDWESSQGTLRTFVRTAEGWKEVHAAVPVVIGRAGAAWGAGLHAPQPGPQKREGDGRSPAGAFALGAAFGYADSASTSLPYEPMELSDWCIDVSASPLYNRIVDAAEVGVDAIAGSTEPMRRDLHVNGDQRYKLGFVIENNPANEPDAGSCIFAHVWKSADAPTAGCTAMAEPEMRRLLSWLRPDPDPVFVLLPVAEYERLHGAWDLPEIARRAGSGGAPVVESTGRRDVTTGVRKYSARHRGSSNDFSSSARKSASASGREPESSRS